MSSQLIVNVEPQETRVALLESNIVTELYVERKQDEGIVGNVYKGKVTKVLPGMQAAFVDIGLDRAGFLWLPCLCRRCRYGFLTSAGQGVCFLKASAETEF